jgi:hypothetical protein
MPHILWNLRQKLTVHNAGLDAINARYGSQNTALRLAELENSLQRLLLINHALWELLRDHVGLTPKQLLDKVNEIDLRDGKLDGRESLPPTQRECSKCGRILSRRHQSCIYCGEPTPDHDPFESV